MERCPNCRARYQEGERCRRCGMELASLLRVETAAERLIQSGLHHLARDELAASLRALKTAGRLRRDPFIDLLLGFVDNRSRPSPRQEMEHAAIDARPY
jgi:hypothetical protein